MIKVKLIKIVSKKWQNKLSESLKALSMHTNAHSLSVGILCIHINVVGVAAHE